MATRSNKTYQDPRRPASLSRLLKLWQDVPESQRAGNTIRVTFTLSCWGESRATRVAGFLRRRRECAESTIHRVAGGRRDTWHVHGSTHPAIRSLADLEHIWTWLRAAARSHQVDVVRIRLVQEAV